MTDDRLDELQALLLEAAVTHLADETTIYQLERQVATLRHMWAVVHAGLGLHPSVSLSPEMVLARLAPSPPKENT